MKKKYSSALLTAAVSLTLVAAALAQGGSRNYNPSTETTFKGTVEEVKQTSTRWRSRTGGTHLTVTTDKGRVEVHLGPTAFLDKQNFVIAKGDQLEILGSKVTQGGQEILLAREVRKEGKTLTLRNAQGVPAWSKGWRNQ